MLTNLEVFGSGLSAPPLPIVDQSPALDMLQITNIDGLGPVAATVSTTQYGNLDGEYLSGTSTPQRNIVLTVRLNPDWTSQSVETLRRILYLYFMPESTVKLRFSSTHMPTVEISGVVESCEPNMFDKDPVYQISIICPSPYFIDVNQTTITGVTQALTDTSDTVIPYQGDVNTGFVVDIDFPSSGSLPDGSTSFNGEFRLINNSPSTNLFILTGITPSATRTVEVSTIQGSKYVENIPRPTGLATSILTQWASGSAWLNLVKGDNHMQFLSTKAGLVWTMNYYARYGGL